MWQIHQPIFVNIATPYLNIEEEEIETKRRNRNERMNRSRCLCAHLMMLNKDPTSHHFSQCFDIEPLTALFTSSLRVLHLADPARMFESYCPIFALENHALASNICWESSQCQAISWGMIICMNCEIWVYTWLQSKNAALADPTAALHAPTHLVPVKLMSVIALMW